MWELSRPGDVILMDGKPMGIALTEVRLPWIRAHRYQDFIEKVKSKQISIYYTHNSDLSTLNTALDTSSSHGFDLWKDEIRKRKLDIQRRYSGGTNTDWENRLRPMEEWEYE